MGPRSILAFQRRNESLQGSVPTLAEAVRVMVETQLNADLSSGQVDDLVSFLKNLTGRLPDEELPELPN